MLDFDLLSSGELNLQTIKQIKEANILVQKEYHFSKTAKRMQQRVTKSANTNTMVCMIASEMGSMRKEIQTMMENLIQE